MTRDEMKTKLQSGVYNVQFVKADGTLREMKCTLQNEYLPTPELLTEDGSEPQKKRLENENVLPVWDINEDGWRSFRLDSIVKVDQV